MGLSLVLSCSLELNKCEFAVGVDDFLLKIPTKMKNIEISRGAESYPPRLSVRKVTIGRGGNGVPPRLIESKVAIDRGEDG